jgi:HEAT repeat protein
VRIVALILLAALGALGAGLPSAQDTGELEGQLRSSRDSDRRKAVQALAKLGTPAAWELVLGALDDAEPMVADEAQLQLAEVRGDESLALVFGKHGLGSRDAFVRVRVAEALGRMQASFDFDRFERPLKDKDARVRRALLWSVERIGARAGFADARPAGRSAYRMFGSDRDPGARAAALMAAYAIDEPGELSDETLEEILGDRDAACRSAGILLAGRLEDRALRFVPRGCADEDRGVRTVATEVLGAMSDARAALALVDRLEREPSLRLRWRIVELLQAMSGRKHRLDPRPWRDWAEGLEPGWSGGDSGAGAQADHGEVSAAFAGLPILSQRVVFLIDLSGSVWDERPDGRTRKSLIDVELRKALEALGQDDHFNLIPYTSQPIPWKKQLLPAKAANVAKALAWFEGRKDSGKGNFWDAAMLAMEDDGIDSIIVLTDGAPSGGQRWNMLLMKELFREHNRFRRIALDCVIADRSGFLVEQWAEMCAASGGHMIQVSFE